MFVIFSLKFSHYIFSMQKNFNNRYKTFSSIKRYEFLAWHVVASLSDLPRQKSRVVLWKCCFGNVPVKKYLILQRVCCYSTSISCDLLRCMVYNMDTDVISSSFVKSGIEIFLGRIHCALWKIQVKNVLIHSRLHKYWLVYEHWLTLMQDMLWDF